MLANVFLLMRKYFWEHLQMVKLDIKTLFKMSHVIGAL